MSKPGGQGEAAHPRANLTETCLQSRSVFEGRLLHVLQDTVRLPDGGKATREYIRHPGAVVMIAFPEAGQILLERQFRYPLRREFIELPAGKLHVAENPLECARRELLEETGYVAERWTQVAELHPCIGYSDERLIYYHAAGLRHQGRSLDEGEFLEVVRMSLAEALEWVKAGKITDAKTVAGLYMARGILQGEWGAGD